MNIEEQVIYEKLKGIIPIHDFKEAEAVKNNINTQSDADVEDKTLNNAAYIDEIIGRIASMERTRENYAFRNIYSCRKYIGPIIVFCKRVVRKILKWYIEPICFQQTEFNNAVTPAIGRLCELQNFTIKKQNEIHKAVDVYKEQLKCFEDQVATLKQCMAEYQIELENTKNCIRQQQERIKVLNEKNAVVKESLQSMMQLSERTAEVEFKANANASRLNKIDGQMEVLQEAGAFVNAEANADVTRRSTSQSGEDTIIDYILRVLGKNVPECTYLDLGANHAKYLSNTFYFYQKGARGVLVEANPDLIGELKLFRSGDTILNNCIASESNVIVPFYILNGDGLSTPDLEEAQAAIAENNTLRIEKTVQVKTVSVNELMNKYFDCAPTILSIDIEGKEMEILRSIDFKEHRPLVISIETIPYRKHLVVEEKRTDIVRYMAEIGYTEYAFTGINSIFLDKSQIGAI